jgi:hypothetical protein
MQTRDSVYRVLTTVILLALLLGSVPATAAPVMSRAEGPALSPIEEPVLFAPSEAEGSAAEVSAPNSVEGEAEGPPPPVGAGVPLGGDTRTATASRPTILASDITDPSGDVAELNWLQPHPAVRDMTIAGNTATVLVPTWLIGDPSSFYWWAVSARPSAGYSDIDWAPDSAPMLWTSGFSSSTTDPTDDVLQPYEDLAFAGVSQADATHIQFEWQFRGDIPAGEPDVVYYFSLRPSPDAASDWVIYLIPFVSGWYWEVDARNASFDWSSTSYEDIVSASVNEVGGGQVQFEMTTVDIIPETPASGGYDPWFGWKLDVDNDPATGQQPNGDDMHVVVRYNYSPPIPPTWEGVVRRWNGTRYEDLLSVPFTRAGNAVSATVSISDLGLSQTFRWAAGTTVVVGTFGDLVEPEKFFFIPDRAPDSAWVEMSLTFTCDIVSEIPTAECEALVALYDSTDGDNWSNNSGWLDTNAPCSWYGVTCDAGHVTQLWLYGNQLSGNIPPELGSLVNLTSLGLGDSQLIGSIPAELGYLASLQELWLSGNQLSGSIPPELGDLANLTHLCLYDNQLNGNIPPELGNLASLRVLDLEYNRQSGSVPAQLGDLSSLIFLNLANNRLSGSIPAELGNLVDVYTLRLVNNALEGEIPSTLVNLVELEVDPWRTDFGYNRLTASDPALLAFLDDKDPDWADTQTVPPTDVRVVGVSSNTVELSWTPITYTAHGGYYEVNFATTPGGPYTAHGTASDKTATGYLADNLSPDTTYYFVVRTYTPAHGDQKNDLWSGYSEEVSATTGAPDDTPPTIANIRESDDPINRQGCPGPTIVTIRADVTDVSGLAWVQLYYYQPPSGNPTYVTMIYESGNTYRATIGPFSLAGMVYYSIDARDNAGNDAMSDQHTFYVNDCDITPPAAITNLTARTGSTAGAVNLSWRAPGDDGNTGKASQYDVRHSASPINEGNWPFATPVDEQLSPGPADSVESMTVYVPFPDQVHYFAIKTADEVPNWSDLSNAAWARSGQTEDTIPPGRITSLVATTGSSLGEVDLIWSAPADDGYDGASGRADRYVVRYNTEPVDRNNWDDSLNADDEPTPGPAGSTERMTVQDLEPGERYCFAVRAYDDEDNLSDVSISKCAVAYEMPLPDLIVTDLTVDRPSAHQGDSVQIDFTVKNNSDSSPADFKITNIVYLSRPGYHNERARQVIRDGLAAGESSSSSYQVRIPSDAQPADDYHIVVVADGLDTEHDNESSEDNNEARRALKIEGTPSVDLEIVDIEVSQGIQVFHFENENYSEDPYGLPPCCNPPPCTCSEASWSWEDEGPGNNQVRLVRGRTTIVRVYVDIGEKPVQGGVEGSLRYRVGSGSQWHTVASYSGPIQLHSDFWNNPQETIRRNAHNSLNFLIPGDQLQGDTLTLRATVDPVPGEDNEDNNTCPDVQVTLHSRDPLRVRLRPIEIIKDGQSLGTGSLTDSVDENAHYSLATLPFADGNVRFDWLHIPHPFETDCSDGEDERLLNELESLDRGDYDVIVGVFSHRAGEECATLDFAGKAYDIGRGHSIILVEFPGGQEILMHELSHLIPGLRHPYKKHEGEEVPNTREYACGAADQATWWPYGKEYHLREVGAAVREFRLWGWDKHAGDLLWSDKEYEHHDVMSYCKSRWVSPYSWESWMAKGTPEMLVRTAEDGGYLLISGLVYTASTAAIDPIWVSSQLVEPPIGPGDYCVQTLDIIDTVLAQECFGLDFLDCESGEPQGADTFLVSLPKDPSIAKVQLTHNGTPLDEIVSSTSSPSVTVTYPNGGEALTETFPASWTGGDADGDALVYRLFYSADNGTTWSMLTNGISETTFLVDPADLPGTETGLFKVVASDGFHNAEDQSDGVLVVPRKAPVPVINSTLDGASVPLSTTLAFDGLAFDHEDGSLSDTDFAWTSNLDGPLGVGSLLYTPDLSPGIHRITLAVTDSDGMTGTHSVYLEVLEDADQDHMPDQWEQRVGLDPTVDDAYEDADKDGLSNLEEFRYASDPLLFDTDYDGYGDLTEILRGSDPLDPDSIPIFNTIYLPVILRNYTPGTEPTPRSTPTPAPTTEPGSLTLTSPNGGESWHVGTVHDVTWSSTGSIANVRLEYSKDGFVSDVHGIVASTPNDGTYSWTVPNDSSTTVRVRVSDASNSSINDTSDAGWAICNNLPYSPSNPSPSDGATNQPITVTLSWTGGDPDGDNVTYDVYMGSGTTLLLVCDDVASPSCDPGTLSQGTLYRWQVIATDEHGATTIGPVWDFTTQATPTLRYIALTGSDIGDCGASAYPCRTVQYAVDLANPGDEIRVAAGTYTGVSARNGVTQVVYISKTVAIRGGYTTADWTTSAPVANPTTLDALGRGRVLYITGDISPTIEGLRITGGNAAGLGGTSLGLDAGGAVYIATATATVSNNHVFSNVASYGGGLYLHYSDAMLNGNIVTANTADFGGGLDLYNSAAMLSGNTVSSNTANANGGGLYLPYSTTTLSGNIITANAAWSGGGLDLFHSPATLSGNAIAANTAVDEGGGLYLDDSDATLINNIIVDNRADNIGSGLYIERSSPRLQHTTIVRNAGGDGYGIYITDFSGIYSSVAMTNTILVSHTVGVYVTSGNTATLEATLWGDGTWANIADWGGAGTIITGTLVYNYWGDPAFVNPDAGNYHIGPSSAARDAGVDAGVTADIDGQTRPQGTGYDIGADEYWP